MKERFKSLTLFVLVLASLVQTYMLAYSKPYYEQVEESKYIQPELIGTRAEAADLIYPSDIILHLGDGQHVVFYPNNVFYDEIFDKVSVRSFGGFKQIERISVDWYVLREQYRGVEIRFNEQIPANILESSLHIEGSLPNVEDTFDKIWISMNATGEDVRTFFFNSWNNVIYEATKADLTSKDVEQFVSFGDDYPTKYKSLTVGSNIRTLYIPLTDLEMVKVRLGTEAFTPEQLQNNLFVNPGITRKLMERDGTEIYTDGKRGLQIYHDRHWMSFSDPIAPVETSARMPNHLLAAVQFVNQHGGWNGDYRIERYAVSSNQEYVFRQYYRQYPIVDLDHQPLGMIKVVMNNGSIPLYERSLLTLLYPAMREEVSLPGGEVLQEKIREHPERTLIERVYPAYRPTLEDDEVVLTPIWVIDLVNRSKEYISW